MLVDASGWNPQDRYVWGRVDRPGTYAAVALPKDTTALRRVGLEMFLRRSATDAVATGHLASLADVADRAAFRDYFATRHHVDEVGAEGRRRLTQAVAAHRDAVREVGRTLPTGPLGGNPQWLVLDDILLRLPDLRDALKVDDVWRYWPILARVANRVGPWFPLGPTNINGRVKSVAMHRSDSNILLRRLGQRWRLEVDQRRRQLACEVEVPGEPRDRRRGDRAEQRQRRLRGDR